MCKIKITKANLFILKFIFMLKISNNKLYKMSISKEEIYFTNRHELIYLPLLIFLFFLFKI